MLLEDEGQEKSDNTAEKTNKDEAESNEPKMSVMIEETTADVSSEAKKSSDVELENAEKVEEHDEGKVSDADKSESVNSVKNVDASVESKSAGNVLDSSVDKSGSLDKAEEGSTSEKKDGIDDSSEGIKEQGEENVSDEKVSDNSSKQEVVDDKDMTGHNENIDKTKSGSETEEDVKDVESDENVKIDSESVKKNESSIEDKKVADTQQQALDFSVDKKDETLSVPDSKETPEDMSDEESEGAGPMLAGSSVEKESSNGNSGEERNLEDQKEVKTTDDLKDNAASSEENTKEDTEKQGDALDSGSTERERQETDEDSELLERKDSLEEGDGSKNEVDDEGKEGESQDKVKNSDNEDKPSTDSQEDADGNQKETEEESTGGNDTEEEPINEYSPTTGDPTTGERGEELPQEKMKLHSEEKEDERKDEKPDGEGILAALKKFLPGGESTKEDEDSKEETTNVIFDLKKIKISDEAKVEKVSPEDKEVVKDNESLEVVDATLKLEDEDGEPMINETDSIEEVSDNDFDKSEEEEEDKILADILNERSVSTDGAAVPEVGVKSDSVNVESGSTQFQNITEETLPVEKTLDKELEMSDSTSQEGEVINTGVKDIVTGVENTKTGIEDTKVGYDETGSSDKTGIESVVAPTKTSTVIPSETITAGHRAFEKKFPNIGSKWMKSKLMKGKQMEEKDRKPEDLNENLESRKGDEGQQAGGLNESLEPEALDRESPKPEALDPEDPHSGTCSKDGICERKNAFSSSIHRSILESNDDLENDELGEPKIYEEKPEVKSVKEQFLGMLAVAVRNFRKYHNLVAGYGLQMLKPFANVMKSLGEQMGFGEVSAG